MRWSFRMFAIASIALAGLAMTVANGRQPPGGFFGKGGGGKGTNYFTLITNPAVQKELNATEKQMDKLPEAQLKALAEVFDAKQVKRLREIYLQQRGTAAYLDSDVKKELKITDDQSKKIKDAIDAQAKEQQEMLQGGNFDFERMQELQKTTTEKVEGVLTAVQKSTWSKMVGEKFDMPFGFGKKKKDGDE
jgi:Spy/CpxP family protein refolding chaperone